MILRILKTMASALGYRLVRADYQITAHVTFSAGDNETTVDIELKGPATLLEPKITFNPPPENLLLTRTSEKILNVERIVPTATPPDWETKH